MMVLHSSFYAIAIGFCLLCGMLVAQARNNVPIRYFFLYLVIEAFSFSFEWLMIHPDTPYKGLWLTGIMSLSFFIAPCLWLFARELNDRRSPSIRPLPNWHWQTVALGLLLLSPLLSSIHAGTGFINESSPVSEEYSLFIHTTMLLAVLLFLMQTVYYIRECLSLLSTRTKQNLSLFSEVSDPAANTLRLLIIAVVANWIVSAARTLYCLTIGAENGFGVVFAGFELAVITFVIVSTFKHEVSYRSGDQAVRESVHYHGTENGKKKYAHSTISQTRRLAILDKLHISMANDKLYCRSDLSLRLLCEHIDEPTHTVSQVINESNYGRFYDMINRWRINAAKELLIANSGATILDIAFAVGYNSKSTFNAAFRKFAETTPSQFRADAVVRRSLRPQ